MEGKFCDLDTCILALKLWTLPVLQRPDSLLVRIEILTGILHCLMKSNCKLFKIKCKYLY